VPASIEFVDGSRQEAPPPARGEHHGVRLLSTHVAVPETASSLFGLAVSTSAEGETIHVRAAGELDLARAPQLASDLAALIGSGGAIKLDLGRVTFIDLAGLRTILDARRDARARDQELCIAVAGPAYARLLELTRTTELLLADHESPLRSSQQSLGRYGR
jgi:anti-anti-sigma factor